MIILTKPWTNYINYCPKQAYFFSKTASYDDDFTVFLIKKMTFLLFNCLLRSFRFDQHFL